MVGVWFFNIIVQKLVINLEQFLFQKQQIEVQIGVSYMRIELQELRIL
jgi:hypothetical protein